MLFRSHPPPPAPSPTTRRLSPPIPGCPPCAPNPSPASPSTRAPFPPPRESEGCHPVLSYQLRIQASPLYPPRSRGAWGRDYRSSFRGRRGKASPQQQRCGGETRRRFSPGSCSRHEPARTPGPPFCSARGRRGFNNTALDEGLDSELGSLAKETILIECA